MKVAAILKRAVIVFLHVLIYNGLSAQTAGMPKIIPPSPQAAAFARYGEIPVDYSTGVPEIEIPFFTVSSGALSLPISVSYHASGIKVKDVSSCVGLGWVLNANGIISRAIFGEPDDYPATNPSPYKSKQEITDAILQADEDIEKYTVMDNLDRMYDGNADIQKDRYSYNFNRHSGIFRYDFVTNEVRTIPFAPIKITKHGSPPNLYFMVIDENGIVYSFEASESSNGYLTSWLLTSMTSADGTDQIQFFYSNSDVIVEKSLAPVVVRGKQYNWNLDAPNYEIKSVLQNNYSFTTYGTKRLDSITAENAVVKFAYLQDRLDAAKTRLTSISLLDKRSRSVKKKIEFLQSYFGESVNPNPVMSRLRLDSVYMFGEDENDPPQRYAFKYDNGYMPMPYYPAEESITDFIARQGFSEDYWGYFNNGGSALPQEYMTFVEQNFKNVYGYGGSRNPRADLMSLYTINEIRYPTGGKTVFEFEPHRVSDILLYDYPNSNDGMLGGLRIKRMLDYASDTLAPSVKSYQYGSEHYQRIMQYSFRYQQPVRHIIDGSYQPPPPAPTEVWLDIDDEVREVLMTVPSLPLTQSNGSSVIYNHVVEYVGTESTNIGKTVYEYTPPVSESTFFEALARPQYYRLFAHDRDPYVPRLQSKTIYKAVSNGYEPLSKTENTYGYFKQHSFSTGIALTKVMEYIHDIGPDPRQSFDYDNVYNYINNFYYDDMKGYEDVQLLTRTKNTEYFDGTPVITTTDFIYDDADHLLPVERVTTDSNGEETRTEYKYPVDFALSSSPNVYDTMVSKNILSPVIEQLEYKDTSFLQSTKTNYKRWGNTIIAPEHIDTRQGTAFAQTRVRYHGYDTDGNIIDVSKENDLRYSYLWGYNQTHPVAQVTNGRGGIIAYTSFESEDKGNWNYTGMPHQHGARTGECYYKLSEGSVSIHLSPGKYSLQCWHKGTVNTSGGTITSLASSSDLNGWILKKCEVAITSSVDLIISGSGDAVIDELRLYPVGAQMTTYTYDALVGITSATDPNNVTTYYQYDTFGRLQLIKDNKGNIVKAYTYHYKQ